MGYDFSVQWRSAVIKENGNAYQFPDKFTRFFREKYSKPVVYRWRILKNQPEEKEPIYIGEAEELPRRIQRVLTPSKAAKDTNTNRRLNKIFHEFLSQGRVIVVDIADVDPFEINGVPFGRQTMGDQFKRRAMENILLAMAQKAGEFKLLNVLVDPIDKVEKKLSKFLPPHKVTELLGPLRAKG